ncbi:MAG TPA: HAD family hydrolase [Agitococcus sp.]|jgi:HAD superfamily hydrolase (TIGR01490 family)|nr:HAD family hydrolase [Moraxellaceae bacterium]MBL0231458.1 HAD family hydrolase [Moraxellaceae bacterium]MCC6375155.1 HAD family hydrolase [Moraxellaceae bacterium]HQV80900.1 HAD family hydrolase [Agitococcus sp.]
MKLAIFDLDNTLIAGDSDHAWGEFLVAQGLVDGVWYKAQNDKFYADYCTGQLDIIAYSEFVFGFLAQHDMSYLQQLHQQFMAQVIQPIMLPKAQALIQQHRDAGDFLLIITATNRFITQPIGEALGISELLATEPQQQVGRYTGKVEGVPCYKEGKITRYQAWLSTQNIMFEQVFFYSDSHNDLPLLKIVDTPIAVDPDDTLKQYAQQQNWPILSLRD